MRRNKLEMSCLTGWRKRELFVHMLNSMLPLPWLFRYGFTSPLHEKNRSSVSRVYYSSFVSTEVVLSGLQRIWRGRSVARKAAAEARANWDTRFLSRHGEDQSPVSADTISNQMLRPLFMILRHSSCFSLHQTQEGSEDAGRLATCFRLLLQSINNPGRRG